MTKTIMMILGNGGAACHAVQAARDTGYRGEIHMVSDVREPAFNPMLAPYYLKGRLGWEQCYPFGADFYNRHDVICHFGSPVTELNVAAQTVGTADGSQLGWDTCLVATGADAVIPPVPGLKDSPFAYALRTAESMRHLESVMATARKAVILGASLVGVKMAEILSYKNADVLVVDVADQVMPRGAHPLAAEHLRHCFEEHGVDFRLGCALEGLSENEGGVCCFFPEAIVDDADFIGVCTGIQANLSFIDRAQVNIDMAILIDDHCQSNAAGLYAAGDCAQGINPMTGEQEWLGTWVNACYQGRTAGINMAGGQTRFEGFIPQHISPFFGWTYAQVGNAHAAGATVRVETHGNPFKADGKFSLLVFDEDRLVGANLINCTEYLGAIKQAISAGRPWSADAWVPGHSFLRP